ncbi:MAG: alpha/beta fold hydrolase [Dehalococcoidia bacterium]
MTGPSSGRRAQHGSVSLVYDVIGAGPPLLLLHPGLCSGDLWTELGYTEALRHRFRLLIVDLRGHGRSNAPHTIAGYDADAMRDDIAAVLDAEGLKSAHCWGFSLGALLLLRLAAARPHRLRSLIAGGAVGYLPDPAVGTRSAERIEASGIAALAPPVDGDPAALPMRPVIIASDPIAHAARYRAQALWPPPVGLHDIAVRLLLYGGEADSFTGPVRELATRLPNADLITVPKMGHLQLWCHPEAMLPAALAFLERQS